LVGQTIASYRLTSLLAQERSTAIYGGEDVRDERAVTIQVWQRGRSEAAPGTPRIDEVSAALGHPNVAQVFEAGIWEGAKPYRVMEPLDGETLASRLRVQACVRVPEALAIAREAAGALEAAHAAGIVHGQLTPANVFINLDPTAARGERVKLLELGVDSGVQAQPVEPRADCRALGELLFEMLCGFPPSLVEEEAEGQRSDGAPAVPAPSSLNPDVPEALDHLILVALSTGQEGPHRFGSMAELLRALDSLALGPQTIAAPGPSETPEPTVSATLGTSAFDVPPVALPAAPPAPLAAASWLSRLRALVVLRGLQPARMAAGVAIIGMVVALSLHARRGHPPRSAGPHRPRAAAALPPSVPAAPSVQMATARAVTTKALEVRPDSPSPPITAAPSAVSPPGSTAERACLMSIGSRPWSEVWIDGKNTGHHTPLVDYKLPCGRRTLTLKNAELALAKSMVITLKPRSRFRKVFRLGDPDAAQNPSGR
jgi:serine/threonine-protein kinase